MELAARVVGWCLRAGVREAVVCAGARNLPLVATWRLAPGVQCWNFPEERCAGFFALGRARAASAPVAVVVTSGTAVAELLPAAIEAFYQGVPLVMVTADRPRAYRGTGAPQAIEQPGIFGPYAPLLLDASTEEPWAEPFWDARAPAHLNLCFDEPMLDGPARAALPGHSAPSAPKPDEPPSRDAPAPWEGFGDGGRLLVMVGPLETHEQGAARAYLRQLGAPVWVEAGSGLWGDPELEPYLVRDPTGFARSGLTHLLRLGGVPCDRLWRDLEHLRDVRVLSLSRTGWSGLARPNESLRMDFRRLAARPVVRHKPAMRWESLASHAVASSGSVGPTGLTEDAWFAWLSRRMPSGSLVFLGNSLPIRQWQAHAAWRDGLSLHANRGANGIDGEVSTFLGLAAQPGLPEAWGIFGDLTALYDLAALWVLGQMPRMPLRLVVINNGGGKIFADLPATRQADGATRRMICNAHQLEFSGWAALWNLPYRAARAPEDLGNLPDGPVVIEIFPCDGLQFTPHEAMG